MKWSGIEIVGRWRLFFAAIALFFAVMYLSQDGSADRVKGAIWIGLALVAIASEFIHRRGLHA